MKKVLLLAIPALGLAAAAHGQQTGSVTGTVSSPQGEVLPGVTVEASGDVLPRPRSTTTDAGGGYRLPLLPPGDYRVSYSLGDFGSVTRRVTVLLQQGAVVDVTLGLGVSAAIDVVGEVPAIDRTSAELKTTLGNELIDRMPIGQDYRDVIKLIPGVQYSEDAVRGPSAGGSGQDNVYQFDGVDVSLPLFGTLAAEPSSHDIDQVAVLKGGAKAVDFNRSGGFTVNTISKSGTGQWHGEVSYRVQSDGMTGSRDVDSAEDFEEDQDWTVLSGGGPLVRDLLFFYGSAYRPTVDRNNSSNAYGEVDDFASTRDELFGKLSLSPTPRIFLSASLRDSSRELVGRSVGEFDHPSTSEGDDIDQSVGILEGSWVASNRNFFTFKVTDYEYLTSSRPDNVFAFDVAIDGSVRLDVTDLASQGLLEVPTPLEGEDAFNAFIQPLLDRYGYLENGVALGGGTVGGGPTINDADYFRESFQLGWDSTVGTRVTHDLHAGYQYSEDGEDLARLSNGWGRITVPGGRATTEGGAPIYYEARLQQMSVFDEVLGIDPVIRSEIVSQSVEVNDTIRFGAWSVNVGLMASNDALYGQGLRENDENLSGFELAPGHRYRMIEIDWHETLAPRLGVVWAYAGDSTVFVHFARYYPRTTSLPRAASWARNLRREIQVRFDAEGNVLEVTPIGSSSGKFFAEDLDPRFTDEFLFGTSRRFSPRWTARASARYRYAANFWEDTNNDARSRFDAPEGFPRGDYIPELGDYRAEVGGSSFVVAELDGAFTKYWEVAFETEWRGRRAFFRGSYVWSHYYGNFDQDNTTTNNDANTFYGSSFLADDAGRQIWDNRYGDLRGDRRHQLKLFGYASLPWGASAGATGIFQSGQPWEEWNVEAYRDLTSSTRDTGRYAESAGSRTTASHWQLDLSYTQDVPVGGRFGVQLRADLFNTFDRQTGYDIQNEANSAGFGDPRSFYRPRRLQLAVKLRF